MSVADVPLPAEPIQLPLALQLPTGMRFANFEVGRNGAVLDALRGLATAEGALACLWGAPGSGRTHLASAVAAEARTLGPVAYVPMRDHASLDVAVLDGLQRCALVIIDDVDAVAGHGVFEEGLNHLHNRVRAAGAGLLYVASCAPAASGIALADLRSRLAAGAVWQLAALDEAGLCGALAMRANERGIALNVDTASYLVRRAPRDMRVLMRHLDQLDRISLRDKRRPTVALLREVLRLPTHE